MLDACREDDWGQRVCQVIPEDVTLNIKFGWYCLHAEYNSFAVRKNLFLKAFGWNFLVLAFLHLLAEGVFGNPGMLPSFGLARLAWKPASLSSVLIAWEVMSGCPMHLWDLLDLLDLLDPLMGSILPDHMDTQSGQPPPHTGARRPTDESHLLYRWIVI